MESILPEITKWLELTKWLVYALIGDSDSHRVTATSAYTCATLLMAAAIHLLFGT